MDKAELEKVVNEYVHAHTSQFCALYFADVIKRIHERTKDPDIKSYIEIMVGQEGV